MFIVSLTIIYIYNNNYETETQNRLALESVNNQTDLYYSS